MATKSDDETLSPKQYRSFLTFFKNYMSLSSIIVGALPIPATSLKWIPRFSSQAGILSVCSSLICFLLLGYIFYNRHPIGRIFVSSMLNKDSGGSSSLIIKSRFVSIIPFLCILGTIVSLWAYLNHLDTAIGKERPVRWAQATGQTISETEESQRMGVQPPSSATEKSILAETERSKIWDGNWLMIKYVMIFVFAEFAFGFMALKEWYFELLKFDEHAIMHKTL